MKYIESKIPQKIQKGYSVESLIGHITKTDKNCIIHGFAGSGKSTFIRHLAYCLKDRCLKLAPTGNTAYNIDGTTLDSLLYCYQKSPNSTLTKLAELYDMIIIEEISMVHNCKLEAIFQILQDLYRQGKKIKLVLIGDPFQLPPVVTNNMMNALSQKYKRQLIAEDFYFFNSKRFQDNFNYMECFLLEKNYRQNDTEFENVLIKISQGLADQDDLDYLNQKVVTANIDPYCIGPLIIAPTRNGVNFFNQYYLRTFQNIFMFEPVFEKMTAGYEDIESDYNYLLGPISYSIGVPVVFFQNDLNNHWVNGTKGVIQDHRWDNYRNPYLSIRTERGEELICVQTKHRLQRFVFNPEKNTIENETVAVIRQFPFILGFAITVHRAQGMTLDSMAFNIGEGLFSPGQLYVALSRVRKLDDLTLHVPLEKKDIIVSPNVREYFDVFISRCIHV
jgi:hypothetical protein